MAKTVAGRSEDVHTMVTFWLDSLSGMTLRQRKYFQINYKPEDCQLMGAQSMADEKGLLW